MALITSSIERSVGDNGMKSVISQALYHHCIVTLVELQIPNLKHIDFSCEKIDKQRIYHSDMDLERLTYNLVATKSGLRRKRLIRSYSHKIFQPIFTVKHFLGELKVNTSDLLSMTSGTTGHVVGTVPIAN